MSTRFEKIIGSSKLLRFSISGVPDDVFLLMFLRPYKYRMDNAFRVFENLSIFRATHPDWFDLSDASVERAKELYKTGFAYELRQRSSDGQRILLVNHSRFDCEKFSVNDIIRLSMAMLFVGLHEEESQICGTIIVQCCKDVTFKYINMCSSSLVADTFKFLKNCFPSRVIAVVVMNFPAAGAFMYTAAKPFMSKKLQDRLHMVNSVDEASQFIDKSLLPKELGGDKFTEAEMLATGWTMFERYLPMLRLAYEADVDLDKSNYQENVGSFRKLEID